MPLEINNTKKFGVKFTKKGEYLVERIELECLGRTDAKDKLLELHPEAQILEIWQLRT